MTATDNDDDDGVPEVAGWTPQAVDVLDTDGTMLVLDEPCTTCILAGGRSSISRTLRAGRVREMVDATRENGHIPCHSTLSNVDPGAAVCRGWFDLVGEGNQVVQVMTRLGFVRFVSLEDRHGDRVALKDIQVNHGNEENET